MSDQTKCKYCGAELPQEHVKLGIDRCVVAMYEEWIDVRPHWCLERELAKWRELVHWIVGDFKKAGEEESMVVRVGRDDIALEMDHRGLYF